jgi:hypothetical protein
VIGAFGICLPQKTFRYFALYGAEIISARAILSDESDMLFSLLYLLMDLFWRFTRNRKYPFWTVAGFLMLSALIHGLFDFFLMYDGFSGYGWILMIVLFMIGISLFATILNNALNISPFFSYKKSVHSSLVTQRMFLYYFCFVSYTMCNRHMAGRL